MGETKGGVRRWSTDRGSATLAEPAPGVFLFTFVGNMDPEIAGHVRDAIAPMVAEDRKFDVFFDTARMTGYHPAFRQKMTAWHAEVKPWTRSAGVLIGSKVVAMAISVANLMTGGILKPFGDRASFENRVADATREASGPPASLRPG